MSCRSLHPRTLQCKSSPYDIWGSPKIGVHPKSSKSLVSDHVNIATYGDLEYPHFRKPRLPSTAYSSHLPNLPQSCGVWLVIWSVHFNSKYEAVEIIPCRIGSQQYLLKISHATYQIVPNAPKKIQAAMPREGDSDPSERPSTRSVQGMLAHLLSLLLAQAAACESLKTNWKFCWGSVILKSVKHWI